MKRKNKTHEKITNSLVKILTERGYTVNKEVEIPDAKGSIDVLASNGKNVVCYEVKSSPCSMNAGNVLKQFSKYQKFLGEEVDYFLVSPDASGTISFKQIPFLPEY